MLKIYKLGDEILHKKASMVPDFDQTLRDLVEAMFETMHQGDGIGLAAPQVGVLKRVFISNVTGDEPRVFINPEILRTSIEQSTYEEGCLSIPEIYADILRPSAVTIQAWNERGKPFRFDAEGLLARVILHENDHLNGILFIDRVNAKKRKRLVKLYDRKVKNGCA
ncbi:MAG: peptide deformylase [Spirochaetes bacterium]|nr:MAG: peptide deformylase [Spirochaetota bacterium]